MMRKVVVRQTGDPQLVRVYVQGAPEAVIDLCSWTLSATERVEMGQHDKALLLTQTVGPMANFQTLDPEGNIEICGLKVFSYAFKDMEMSELVEIENDLNRQGKNLENAPEFRAVLEKDLIYLGTFGLDNPLNEDVVRSIDFITHGHPGHWY